MGCARGCPGSTCITPVWLERCKLSLSPLSSLNTLSLSVYFISLPGALGGRVLGFARRVVLGAPAPALCAWKGCTLSLSLSLFLSVSFQVVGTSMFPSNTSKDVILLTPVSATRQKSCVTLALLVPASAREAGGSSSLVSNGLPFK